MKDRRSQDHLTSELSDHRARNAFRIRDGATETGHDALIHHGHVVIPNAHIITQDGVTSGINTDKVTTSSDQRMMR